jgi:hypothetical protein
VTGQVFRETTAEPRTQAVPLAHLSLELGHLYMEDFQDGPDRLREHFARVRPWADAARVAAGVPAGGARPRISTCFLVDDYFTQFSSPAELVPLLLQQAAAAGLQIDYLARESACAYADGSSPAEVVESRLVESPAEGSDGSRPTAREVGWLANGQRTPASGAVEAMGRVVPWTPPTEAGANRHSIFMDVELWSEDTASGRTWSCPFLAAVWQLARLGLLRRHGSPVLEPRTLRPDQKLPDTWSALPPLLRLSDAPAPFAAYRTVSVLPSRFLPIEHAVRVVLGQFEADAAALRQVADRAAGERLPVPAEIADRAAYVFYPGP